VKEGEKKKEEERGIREHNLTKLKHRVNLVLEHKLYFEKTNESTKL
jgi:hypothetical protein